jgi:hypothetical protein
MCQTWWKKLKRNTEDSVWLWNDEKEMQSMKWWRIQNVFTVRKNTNDCASGMILKWWGTNSLFAFVKKYKNVCYDCEIMGTEWYVLIGEKCKNMMGNCVLWRKIQKVAAWFWNDGEQYTFSETISRWTVIWDVCYVRFI